MDGPWIGRRPIDKLLHPMTLTPVGAKTLLYSISLMSDGMTFCFSFYCPYSEYPFIHLLGIGFGVAVRFTASSHVGIAMSPSTCVNIVDYCIYVYINVMKEFYVQ